MIVVFRFDRSSALNMFTQHSRDKSPDNFPGNFPGILTSFAPVDFPALIVGLRKQNNDIVSHYHFVVIAIRPCAALVMEKCVNRKKRRRTNNEDA